MAPRSFKPGSVLELKDGGGVYVFITEYAHYHIHQKSSGSIDPCRVNFNVEDYKVVQGGFNEAPKQPRDSIVKCNCHGGATYYIDTDGLAWCFERLVVANEYRRPGFLSSFSHAGTDPFNEDNSELILDNLNRG